MDDEDDDDNHDSKSSSNNNFLFSGKLESVTLKSQTQEFVMCI